MNNLYGRKLKNRKKKEKGFTLKRVCDMTRTYTQMHSTDKYSQLSSIIQSVWPNGWVFVYEVSGCGFESRCSHLNFRYCPCLEQGVPWHSAKYRVWIHCETRTWHDKNIQLKDSIVFSEFLLVLASIVLLPISIWFSFFPF